MVHAVPGVQPNDPRRKAAAMTSSGGALRAEASDPRAIARQKARVRPSDRAMIDQEARSDDLAPIPEVRSDDLALAPEARSDDLGLAPAEGVEGHATRLEVAAS